MPVRWATDIFAAQAFLWQYAQPFVLGLNSGARRLSRLIDMTYSTLALPVIAGGRRPRLPM
jgi:hypothetical protein